MERRQGATHRTTDHAFVWGFLVFFEGTSNFREGWGKAKINCNEQPEIYEVEFWTLDDVRGCKKSLNKKSGTALEIRDLH
jgi:hypothetical protein